MTSTTSLIVILAYFALLLVISWLTSRNSSNTSFYNGDRNSSWFLVAFGMIGASLSGITFISVPGTVFDSGMKYMALVFGFFFGYLVISYVLLPLYYKLNLISIYSYLKERFGTAAYKTGASYFLISRVIGASLRLYLVAEVLDVFLFQAIGLPYWLGIVMTIALIWVYTFKGGIKTIIWTDTIQTAAMLIAVGVTIYFIKDSFGESISGLISIVHESDFSTIVHWKDKSWGTFALGLFNGAFMTIAMTGLDQDMMQKNLSCKNLKEAQRNMFWFSVVLIPVNYIFLSLGVLLYEYALSNEILVVETVEATGKHVFSLFDSEKTTLTKISTDRLFPSLASGGYFPMSLGIVFLVGLIAAAYSSADSALTSLTTSFCHDIAEKPEDTKFRMGAHVGISLLLIIVILVFKAMQNDSIIWVLFTWASFTYGPLLGLYAFGLFTKYKVADGFTPVVAIGAPILTFVLKTYSPTLFNGYQLGFELLPINGLLTFLGLLLIRKNKIENQNFSESHTLDELS